MSFPNLEPNHVLMDDPLGLEVWCPFEIVDGQLLLHNHAVSPTGIWAKEAAPEEVECPVCEFLHGQLHHLGSPDCVDDDATD